MEIDCLSVKKVTTDEHRRFVVEIKIIGRYKMVIGSTRIIL